MPPSISICRRYPGPRCDGHLDYEYSACCLSGLMETASHHWGCSSYVNLPRWGRNRQAYLKPSILAANSGRERFVHFGPPSLLKCITRARTSALATRFHLAGTKLQVYSPHCLCYPAPVEEDAHALAGCLGTGSTDCGLVASKLWLEAGQKRGVTVTALPSDWLLQVAVGLIPCSMMTLLPSDSA